MHPHILVADDEASIRQLFTTVLGAKGYRVTAVDSAVPARQCFVQEPVDVAVLDIRMPGQNGLDLFQELKPRYVDTAFILITAYGTVRTAIEAMKNGAFDYITKPFLIDEVEVVVERALEVKRLKQELAQLKMQNGGSPEERFIGQSPAVQKIFKMLGRVAPTDASVLIQGESGTGKEIVAGLLHHYSPRRSKPLIKVNCAALPEGLLESELFGYEKGAFTGAGRPKPGKLELADGGTVFLDEIGEMTPALQAKLLRVLQEREIERLGGLEARPVDIRLVAATNRNLSGMVARGEFREDLFYRLNVVNITLPPLRERSGDIPLLAEFFVQKYCRRLDKCPLFLSPEAMARLESHNWPGNVRELENVIERAVIMASGPVIRPEHLADDLLAAISPEAGTNLPARVAGMKTPAGSAWAGGTVVRQAPGKSGGDAAPPGSGPGWTGEEPCGGVGFGHGRLPTLREAVQQVERRLIGEALRRTGGNKSRTARLLEISRRALQYKMEAYGLEQEGAEE